MKSYQKVLITLSVFLFAGCSSTGITTRPTDGMTSLPTPIPTKLLKNQLPTATDLIPIPTVSLSATHDIQPTLSIEGMKGVPILREEDITPYIDTFEQVTGNEAILVLKVFHDVKSQPFAAYVDATTNTPFFLTTQDKDGKTVWEAASLENTAEKSGITVGTLPINSQFEKFPNSKNIVLKEFNGLVLTGFDLTYTKSSGPDAAYDWWYPDTMLAFAKAGNSDGEKYELIAQHLVSASDLPKWLVDGNYTNEELMTILTNHISITLQRYPDIPIWTVLNEAWLKTDTYDYLYRRFSNNGQDPEAGAQYVITLFKAARKARPDAILLYSDLDNEFAGKRADMNYQIVNMLKQKGLLDGLAMHWRVDGANPVPEPMLKEMMQSYGVPIYVTEMTIDMTDVQGTTTQRFARQAEIKRQYILTAIESGVCKFIFDWGIQDNYNWLEKDRNRPAADPTMYDDVLNRKPSYFAELAALMPDN